MWIRCNVVRVGKVIAMQIVGRDLSEVINVEVGAEIGRLVFLNNSDVVSCSEVSANRVGDVELYLQKQQPNTPKWSVLRYSCEAQAARAHSSIYAAICRFNNTPLVDSMSIGYKSCPRCLSKIYDFEFLIADSINKGDANE